MLIEYTLYQDIEAIVLTIDNIGTTDTNPIIEVTFTAPAAYYKITKSDGKYIKVIKDFTAGQVLIINTEIQNMELNGVSILKNLDLASRFFRIDKGVNTFTFEPNGVARINFKYNPRYL